MIHLDRIGTIFIGKETGEEEEVIRYDTYLPLIDEKYSRIVLINKLKIEI